MNERWLYFIDDDRDQVLAVAPDGRAHVLSLLSGRWDRIGQAEAGVGEGLRHPDDVVGSDER
jgi:hypothetical protein